MTTRQNIPALRFPEFKGEWRIDSLDNKINFLSGFAFKGEDITEDDTGHLLMRGINITEGYIRHSKDIDKYYCGGTEKLTKYKLKAGEIVIGMDGSKVGRNAALTTEKEAGSLLVQRVCSISAKKDYSTDFIYQHINSNKFHAYVDIVKTSSGIPHISAAHIKDFVIGFPTFAEQQKIADFLTAVDKRIQQLTKKKTLLEQYKKGVMQQIFSRQIRFKDEQGNDYPEWEEKRLGDISNSFSGGTPKTTNKSYYNGEYPFIKSGEISAKETEQSISDDALKNSSAKLVKKGDLLIALYGATSGEVAISQIDGAINQAVLCVRSQLVTEYIYNYLGYQKEAITTKYLQGGQGNLSATIIKDLYIPTPSKPEQQKIADFLSSIDDKISNVQNEIEQTQQFKKGLLQQMFV